MSWRLKTWVPRFVSFTASEHASGLFVDFSLLVFQLGEQS